MLSPGLVPNHPLFWASLATKHPSWLDARRLASSAASNQAKAQMMLANSSSEDIQVPKIAFLGCGIPLNLGLTHGSHTAFLSCFLIESSWPAHGKHHSH